MLQIAGGILVASFVLALIAVGLLWIALDRDNRILGTGGCGYWMIAAGAAAAIGIIVYVV